VKAGAYQGIGCWGIGVRTRGQDVLRGCILNRLIKKYDLDLIYLSGPGHGAPATLSNSYLEGVYSEVYPDKSENVAGMQKFFRQFSFPGGIGATARRRRRDRFMKGRAGYSLSHGFGAAFDNPDLIGGR